MSQQGPAVPAPSFQQQNNLGSMHGYGMSGFARPGYQQSSFGMMNGNPMSQVSQGKQRAQESVPQFDEAAFDKAFADVLQAEEEAHAESLRQQQTPREETGKDDQVQEPEDLALARIREQRPAVYAALKIRSAVDLNTGLEAVSHLDALEAMEANHQLTEDASEAKWVLDALQRISEREAPQEIKTRSERLIKAINERLMSTYPIFSAPRQFNPDSIWQELEAAGYTRSPMSERILEPEHREEQKQEEQQQPMHDDDEMAQTAGRLLERVSDNTSEKFQNSQFLSLMRRLRDREVRVEGDKMVEVSTSQSTSSPSISAPQPTQTQPPPQSADAGYAASIEHFNDIYPPSGMDWGWSDPPPSAPATTIPPIDPKILDHAATDFEVPVYQGGEQEYAALSRHSSHEYVTDEVSGQYSYYNVHSAYHK